MNTIDFRQFATILARFRRGKATTALNTKEQKLLFLFSVCVFSSMHSISQKYKFNVVVFFFRIDL